MDNTRIREAYKAAKEYAQKLETVEIKLSGNRKRIQCSMFRLRSLDKYRPSQKALNTPYTI